MYNDVLKIYQTLRVAKIVKIANIAYVELYDLHYKYRKLFFACIANLALWVVSALDIIIMQDGSINTMYELKLPVYYIGIWNMQDIKII